MHRAFLAVFAMANAIALAPTVYAEVVRPPQVVHLGKSTAGGYFAVVDAGTSSGFEAESEVCLFDAKDRLVLCTQVIVAKRRAAALGLTRKQYDKTIPSMTARLSASDVNSAENAKGLNPPTRDGDDRLELAPSHFFKDGRSAAEISKIERALSRAEPKVEMDPKESGETKPKGNTALDSSKSDTSLNAANMPSEYTIVPSRDKPRPINGRKFRVSYDYHLVMPIKFNHLKLREVTAAGDLKWASVRTQTSAPIGVDLAFQFPSRDRAIIIRGFAAGTAADKGSYRFSVADLTARETSTSTASLFYGAAIGGAWSMVKDDAWNLWLSPGIAVMRSVVDVSVSADSYGSGKAKVANGRSTLNLVMPEVASYVEWTQGYAAAYFGLKAGVPWLAGTRKLDAIDTDDIANSGADQAKKAENYQNMLESLQHDPSKYSLAAFVAGSMFF